MSSLPFRAARYPLRGETVVFTGKLWSLGRKEARGIVERLGGTADDDVTLRTTLLVVGGESYPDGVPDVGRLVNDQQHAQFRNYGARPRSTPNSRAASASSARTSSASSPGCRR